MIVVDLIVTATKAIAIKRAPITAGLLGAEISIKAASDWDGLIKNITFQGAVEKTILNVEDKVFIPPEVVATPYLPLRVGVVGVSDNVMKEEVIPTLWADLGTIAPGATFNADEAVPNVPGTPSPWAQLLSMIGDIHELFTKDKSSLVAAINEVYQNLGNTAWLDKIINDLILSNQTQDERLDNIDQDIADLKYVPIDITKITDNVVTMEMGSTVQEVTVSWELNKPPVSQTLDGEVVDVSLREKTISGLQLQENKSFTLVVTDERNAADSASTAVTFLNGIYYGALATGAVPDSAAVLRMVRKLQSGRGVTFTATPDSGKRHTYACPSRYGTPKFVIGGFEYSWLKIATIEFTNASGYMEQYDIWQHPQDVTGSMTVTVS